MSYYGWGPYVSVAQKRKKAEAAAKKLIKKGEKISPVVIDGKKIASTFWGQAWCEHLESFSDYENRLPRGRSYVKNGYVIHLAIEEGQIEALVQGSSLYKVKITVKEATKKKWDSIVKSCSGKIESVFELLQGKLSKAVIEVITHQHEGLFPLPSEIKLSCSCPDGAYMCKHVAAVMYGVGAKLDHGPELLFTLRQVDQAELITQATKLPTSITTKGKAVFSDDS
ncbi:MAG: SWIM zinc finger family protein, partial [Bacteriovorax sp.]|nr:SWIM zinc finger family protein [Bacteriovorax sp.]